jgi:hypothetical protein
LVIDPEAWRRQEDTGCDSGFLKVEIKVIDWHLVAAKSPE